MGSGDWFKTIVSRKKTTQDRSKKAKGATGERSNDSKWRNPKHKRSSKLFNGASSGHSRYFGTTIEEIAATYIQIAFRRFKARKTLRHLKRAKRLQTIAERYDVQKQVSSTLSHLQSWSKIQTQIRARRACMVTEGRIKQKKQDNQLKLEAELHGIEVEWCGGSETMQEILSRINQREEASVKRERAMAYAFSHQWRANSGMSQGYELGKCSWGWSWTERWIAARPWEVRLPVKCASPNKAKSKATTEVGKNTETSAIIKPTAVDAKGPTKTPPQPTTQKTARQVKPRAPPHRNIKNGENHASNWSQEAVCRV